MEADRSVKEKLIVNLKEQLNELDLLKSMYPNQNEIIITDKSVLEDIKQFVENKSFNVPNHLDYILKIHLNDFKVEIYVTLPTLYPDEEPDVYVRCNQLNRQQETNLNSELSTYIKLSRENEVCLYTAISWLQENIDNFKVISKNVPKTIPSVLNKDPTFVRLWIFSHHIYSRYKREQIIDKSKELNLTGFCLPGKPGIICIEGIDKDCSEWWRDIKSLNWKKISIRKSEVFDINKKAKQQQFKDFQEVSFQNNLPKNSKTALSRFMEEHNLSQEFGEFLGI